MPRRHFPRQILLFAATLPFFIPILSKEMPAFSSSNSFFDNVDESLVQQVADGCNGPYLSGRICAIYYQSENYQNSALYMEERVPDGTVAVDTTPSRGLSFLVESVLENIYDECAVDSRLPELCREISEELALRLNKRIDSDDVDIFSEVSIDINNASVTRCGLNICVSIDSGVQFMEFSPSQASRLGLSAE